MNTTAADTDIELSSRVVRSEAIDFTELDDTVVMMDVDEGRYYELDPVGARVWALIESGPRVGEVCDALAAEYDVAPETCREETGAFLGELSRLAVVQVRQPHEAENDGGATGDHTTGGAVATSAQPGRREDGPKPAWATPTVRVMPIEGIKSGTESSPYFGEGVGQYAVFAPLS
jgi:hypothetical protein